MVKGIDNRGRSQQQSDGSTYLIKDGVLEPLPSALENKKQHQENTKRTCPTPGFLSQLARLAPSSAVLSAVELLPSSYHNPGPGTYKPPDEWSKKNEFEQLRCFLQDEGKKRKEGRQEILA